MKREIQLPDQCVNNNVYIGFRGIAQYGWGVCVDSVMIYETGSSPRTINEIKAVHTGIQMAPQGGLNIPVLRTNIRVRGNTGTVNMTSFAVTSLNSSDADLNGSGVHLYYTHDSAFISPVLVGTGNFSSGKITFNGYTRKLETGDNHGIQ